MPNSIHLTVATVVERDSKFLMVRETIDGEQVINQPAGHVEPGEDVMAAALRETMEETGWEVAITGFLGFSNAMSPTTGITYYRLAFIAEALNFNADAEIDNDIDSAEWMTLDEIKDPTNKPRSEMVHQAIDDFISGRVFSLEMFRNRL
ncbi:MAG: NUDIX hydrolase [Porticoccaceae bacterium]|nr:NUDIX hydrolase [Porticoccaceae bacterium]MBT7565091.1 NUDIX hydrolase [Porticoccaceae bacterium]MBT7947189.1 NUDIX hydrolase [Porticoccaceae bacterium]MDA7589852.1 NUDIX hydrolase [Porticoccaceae bacterium]MDC3200445.1 NUDIX hydrolase [Porticoccaceae bacterium]